MTKEKIIDYIGELGGFASSQGWDDEYRQATIEAIKALKQESVLDKIRDEILKLDDVEYDFEGYYKAVTDALQIIDKYKESEDKE